MIYNKPLIGVATGATTVCSTVCACTFTGTAGTDVVATRLLTIKSLIKAYIRKPKQSDF